MPLNEGQTVQYTVTTTRVPDGTTLYWKTTGNTTNSDIVGGNTGTITVTNNQAVFNVTLAADTATDGTKNLGITLLTESLNGTSVATTPTPIVINDTSLSPVPYSLNYLSVAGGGGGGGRDSSGNEFAGGGGGAGGMLTGTLMTSLDGLSTLTITVGAGGTRRTLDAVATSGANSSIANTSSLVLSVGGGFGGSYSANSALRSGGFGGSGGGGPDAGFFGGAVAGQGYSGSSGDNQYGGGGGGAGGAATYPPANQLGGNAGIGLQSSITGTSTYYAGGGGPGTRNGAINSRKPGGLGGGGAGNYSIRAGTNEGYDNRFGLPGTENTGGGGGAGCGQTSFGVGGNGGSGVVILSYINATQKGAGGNVTTYTSGSDTYWVHTFNTSGIYTVYA